MSRLRDSKKRTITLYNVSILCFISLGSLTYGYTASIIGTTLGQPSFVEYFDLATRSDGTQLISTMNGVFQAGGVIGSLLLSGISDRWGRKWGIAIVSIETCQADPDY